MEKYAKFLKVFKKMRTSDFVYLSVILLFFVVVFILFIYSTNFILKNINKISSPDSAGNAQALDMTNYTLVSKRLDLPINTILENTVVPTAPVDNAATMSTVPTTSKELDKKSITISILNSTSTKGVASTLSKALEKDGFSIATTGNAKKAYTSTTIQIKESKKEYTSLIEEAVKKSYPKAVTEANKEASAFDIVIVISKND